MHGVVATDYEHALSKMSEVEVLTLERQMFERHLLCGPSLLPDILWVRVGVLA